LRESEGGNRSFGNKHSVEAMICNRTKRISLSFPLFFVTMVSRHSPTDMIKKELVGKISGWHSSCL
jgi:hypothetical protein